MKRLKNITLFYSFILIFLITSCSDTSITEYEPKSRDEKEIISVLFQYQDAKNHFDLNRLLSFLHNKGEFSFACGVMVSKTKLQEELPDFWGDIRSNNKIATPLSHECLNGDYFDSGELNNLKIEVNNETAEVSVLVTKGFSRVILLFSLLRENKQWLITRTEWGRS